MNTCLRVFALLVFAATLSIAAHAGNSETGKKTKPEIFKQITAKYKKLSASLVSG